MARAYVRRETRVSSADSAAYQRARRAAMSDPEKERERTFRRESDCQRRYGLSLAERQALLDSQGGCCRLCTRGIIFDGPGYRVAHVDHCHTTGRVRGILCGRCNSAVAALGDATGGLEHALQYLRG